MAFQATSEKRPHKKVSRMTGSFSHCPSFAFAFFFEKKKKNKRKDWRRVVILKKACSQAYPKSASCVQRFDDSLNSAIRITYRISLRSSSLREPRYPLLRVVLFFVRKSRPQLAREEKKTRVSRSLSHTMFGFSFQSTTVFVMIQIIFGMKE